MVLAGINVYIFKTRQWRDVVTIKTMPCRVVRWEIWNSRNNELKVRIVLCYYYFRHKRHPRNHWSFVGLTFHPQYFFLEGGGYNFKYSVSVMVLIDRKNDKKYNQALFPVKNRFVKRKLELVLHHPMMLQAYIHI